MTAVWRVRRGDVALHHGAVALVSMLNSTCNFRIVMVSRLHKIQKHTRYRQTMGRLLHNGTSHHVGQRKQHLAEGHGHFGARAPAEKAFLDLEYHRAWASFANQGWQRHYQSLETVSLNSLGSPAGSQISSFLSSLVLSRVNRLLISVMGYRAKCKNKNKNSEVGGAHLARTVNEGLARVASCTNGLTMLQISAGGTKQSL